MTAPDIEAWWQSRPSITPDPVVEQMRADRKARHDAAEPGEAWFTGWANPLEYGNDGRGWGD